MGVSPKISTWISYIFLNTYQKVSVLKDFSVSTLINHL